MVVTAELTNKGNIKSTETVQLYVRDRAASMVRPVKELKGYLQLEILPGQKKKIRLAISTDQLGFYNQQMEYKTEAGNSASGSDLIRKKESKLVLR